MARGRPVSNVSLNARAGGGLGVSKPFLWDSFSIIQIIGVATLIEHLLLDKVYPSYKIHWIHHYTYPYVKTHHRPSKDQNGHPSSYLSDFWTPFSRRRENGRGLNLQHFDFLVPAPFRLFSTYGTHFRLFSTTYNVYKYAQAQVSWCLSRYVKVR